MASNPASSKSDFLERLSADFTAPVIEACITIDEQQRVVAINPAALRMFGYAGDQILGEEVTRLIPARFQNQHRQQVAGFAGSGDRERPMGRRGTVTGLRSSGEEFTLEASISQLEVHDSLGRRMLYQAMLHEPTNVHGLQAQILSLQQRFRELLDMAPMAMWITEGDLIVFANRQSLALFGFKKREDLINRSLFSLINPESGREVRLQMKRALAGRRNVPVVTERITRPDGSEIEVEIAIAALPDHGTTTIQMVMNNVTARNSERYELERSRSDLRHLSASIVEAREEERRRIARELHDELGQQLSWLKMEMASLDPDAPRQVLYERIAVMLTMLDETMASTRSIASDLRPLMLDDLGLNAAIEWLARESARRMGIEVTVRQDETDPPVDSRTATTLYRTVQEALTNVARHARATDVSIEIHRRGDELVVSVQDNGIGFPPSAVGKAGSFGLLGLRERAYMVGGRLEIDNPPGCGARVTVRIPLCDPEPGANAGGAPGPQGENA